MDKTARQSASCLQCVCVPGGEGEGEGGGGEWEGTGRARGRLKAGVAHVHETHAASAADGTEKYKIGQLLKLLQGLGATRPRVAPLERSDARRTVKQNHKAKEI